MKKLLSVVVAAAVVTFGGLASVTTARAATVDLGWTAEGLSDGALASWTPSTVNGGYSSTAWTGGSGGTKQSGTTNFANVNDWVHVPRYRGDSWQDDISDTETKKNASWEMVFRPGDFTKDYMLFNTDGTGDGTGFFLIGSTLEFRFQDDNSGAQRVVVSKDLSAIGAAGDFFHVVGTADLETASTGTGQLYVNGLAVGTAVTSSGTIADWDGGDDAGLGGVNFNVPGNGSFPDNNFPGDIAIFNYYGQEILGADDVAAGYSVLVPEPATLGLLVLGGGILLVRRRRRA